MTEEPFKSKIRAPTFSVPSIPITDNASSNSFPALKILYKLYDPDTSKEFVFLEILNR
jgi:hypothetical protein